MWVKDHLWEENENTNLIESLKEMSKKHFQPAQIKSIKKELGKMKLKIGRLHVKNYFHFYFIFNY